MITETLKRSIATGGLKHDREQMHAARVLSDLHTRLTTKKSFLSVFAGRDDDAVKGVYIYGGVGRGKSMLMQMFYDALPNTVKKRRIHFHDFMIQAHDYMHEKRSAKETSDDVDTMLTGYAKHIARDVKVLCFDEFHVTDITNAMILGRLFGALFNENICIVTTSNWMPDDLYKDGLQRDLFLPFIDLIKHHMHIVHLDSDTDYREQAESNGRNEHYFTPVNDVSENALNDVYKTLTQNQKPYKKSLKVKGRSLKPVKAHGKTAWFTFSQLCENPMGAEDYLTIARTFDTVFLHGVRTMGYDRRNEAKRFMVLIDALYDEGVTVYITAQKPAHLLYTGSDHAFEFERTVSRLRAMTG